MHRPKRLGRYMNEMLILAIALTSNSAYSSDQYQEALKTSSKALFIQSGYDAATTQVEDAALQETNNWADKKGLAPVVGPTGFIAKSLYKKELKFTLFRNTIVKVNKSEGRIIYGWSF